MPPTINPHPLPLPTNRLIRRLQTIPPPLRPPRRRLHPLHLHLATYINHQPRRRRPPRPAPILIRHPWRHRPSRTRTQHRRPRALHLLIRGLAPAQTRQRRAQTERVARRGAEADLAEGVAAAVGRLAVVFVVRGVEARARDGGKVARPKGAREERADEDGLADEDGDDVFAAGPDGGCHAVPELGGV